MVKKDRLWRIDGNGIAEGTGPFTTLFALLSAGSSTWKKPSNRVINHAVGRRSNGPFPPCGRRKMTNKGIRFKTNAAGETRITGGSYIPSESRQNFLALHYYAQQRPKKSPLFCSSSSHQHILFCPFSLSSDYSAVCWAAFV